MTAMKCLTCGAEKDSSEFYFRDPAKGTRHTSCKQCTKDRVAKNRQTQAKAQRAYDRARPADKTKARSALRRAVRSGQLIKPCTCEDCRQQFPLAMIHGHHEDYAQPLAVNWLCPQCHADRHRKEPSRAEKV